MSDIKGIKKFIRPILGVAFLCIVLASCKNFLNAGKVKEEIEHAIYVNNNECPVATVEEPAFSDGGVAKNKAIMISFTMAIDPQTFDESYSIEDSAGNSLIANFMEPQWSNENKMVTIAADEQNLIDMRGKRTMDIYFKLSKGCQTSDKLPIKTAINHKYRINDVLDETPPTLSVDSYAERPALYLNPESKKNLIKEAYRLIEGELTATSEPDICWNNHLNSKMNIYFEGHDLGGGDVYGHVICKRIRDVNGNDVSSKEKERSFRTDQPLKPVNGSDEKGAELLIDLSGSDYNDGLYEVKVYVQDTTGTDSEDFLLYNVIRDTTFEYNLTSRMFTVVNQYRDDLTPGFNNPPNYVPRDLIDPDGTDTYLDGLKDTNDTSKVRYDFESEGARDPGRWYWGPTTAEDFAGYYVDAIRRVPTKALLDEGNNMIAFQWISDDLFYKSKLTNFTYVNQDSNYLTRYPTDYTYYLSWGLSLDKLTEPVKITGRWNDVESQMVYDLPQDFINYYDQNRTKDVILCGTVADVAGNTNNLINLCPKDIEFYSYTVIDSATAGKKKVKLNFNESAKLDYSTYFPIPDKSIDIRYRIYYGKKGEENLKRNTLVPLERDLWSNETDNSVIDNLEPNTEYTVYIQTIYNFESKTNGIWNGTVNGHLTEVTVDTALSGDGVLPVPVIENVEKVSEGINTGLFKITATITQDSYNAIKTYETVTGRKVKYIPCFNPGKEFDRSRNLVDGRWSFYESSEIKDDRTITFSVKNPLRAPFAKGEAWALPKNPWPANPDEVPNKDKWERFLWDGPIGSDGDVHGDYTYSKAVEACRAAYGYPSVESNIKIVVTDDKYYKESEENKVFFIESDDNIPPKVSSDVVNHDGKLSYDGHSFEFNNLIIENEGHLSEFFNYYYMTYNPSWGDKLPEATSAIESLPGGVAEIKSSTWLDNVKGADYSTPLTIPVYGLEDGQYMFFAKVFDTYGNYTYVTLGKANIGTFKNKLKVELKIIPGPDGLDPDKNERHFQSTLQLEADELNFDRNMINLQQFATYKDEWTGEDIERWGNYYYTDLNALQECLVENVDGKTILRNYNPEQCPYDRLNPRPGPFDDKDVIFVDDWNDEDGHNESYQPEGINGYPQDAPRSLYLGNWFRLTVQSFNENYIIPGLRDNGVDRIYGRPYHYDFVDGRYILWDHDIYGYVEGETKYDVCTEETVSNTVYFFVPGEWWNEWDEYNENGTVHRREFRTDDFSNFHASFFSSNAKVSSNFPYLINIIAAGRDLGNDPDEWERRGKIIKTRLYEPGEMPLPQWYQKTDENGKEPGDTGYIVTWKENGEKDYTNDLENYHKRNPEENPFDYTVAQQDMIDSKEKGLIYYAAVVHFANGTSAVSDTYMMYGF